MMHIRQATADDAERIGELWEQLANYHHQFDSELPAVAPDGATRYAQRILNRLHDRYTHTLVAEVDGVVVGYVLGVIVDMLPEMFVQTRSGFLADIYVDTAYRQKGVGRLLVQSMADWFKAQNVTHYEWYVAANNAAGVAFWRAIGGRDVMIRMRVNLPDDD